MRLFSVQKQFLTAKLARNLSLIKNRILQQNSGLWDAIFESSIVTTTNFSFRILIEKFQYGFICFLDQLTQLKMSNRPLRGLRKHQRLNPYTEAHYL